MEKKKFTKKESGRIALLSLLAIISGCGIALSAIIYFGSEGANPGALVALMFCIGVCTWTIVDACRIQKAVDARTYGIPSESVTHLSPGLYCDNCGAKLESAVKFCSTCGQKVANASAPATTINTNISGRKCPRCSSHNITYQTITEARKTGCGTILLYLFLTFTVFGLLIVIPLMLRKKTDTVTYAVCQNCGNRWRIK